MSILQSGETWDHIIKCQEIIGMRREFVKELVVELVDNKLKDVSVDMIMFFIEDMLRHLDDEDKGEHEINQHLIGMRKLFQGHVVVT